MTTQIRIPPQATLEMWTKQKGKCVYCEQNMILRHKFLMPTIEHIIPKSKGGRDHMSNYCLACYKCNYTRGNIPVEQFLDGYSFTCVSTGSNSAGVDGCIKIRGPKRWYHGNFITW